MPFPYVFEFPFGVLPAVQVLINDAIPDLVKGSPVIDWRLEERSTAEFTTVDKDEAEDYPRGTPVGIWDITDTQIFGGFIDTPDEVSMSPSGGLYHPIRCMDNHYLADKRLVIRSWAKTDVDVIVTALHTDYLADEGVTIGSIPAGPEIEAAVFNYVTVAECFDALAEYVGRTWYIDELKKLYFVERDAGPVLVMPTNEMIKGTPRLSEGNPLYRNRQYIRGGWGLIPEPADPLVPADGRTELFTGDGLAGVGTIAFTLGYPIALVPIVTVSPADVQIMGIKGIDTGKECYWNKGDATITFAAAPDNGKTITVVYYGQYPLISLATNERERIARKAIEGGTGIVESIANEGYHESKISSTESAQAKIAQYCRDAQKFTYQTLRAGIKPGQLQPINYPLLDLINADMLVESVVMRTNGGNLITYDVKVVVGPVMGSWTKLFSSMIRRQDAVLRLGDNYLIALLGQNEVLALAEAPDIFDDEFAISGLVNRWMNTPPVEHKGPLVNVQHERLDLDEGVPTLSTHATEDYHWTDGDKWDFATWK